MYKIIGADAKEYGPVTLDQFKSWVAEGRINAATRVQPVGSAEWKAASEIPEVSALFSGSGGAPPRPAPPPGATPAQPAKVPSEPERKGLAIASFVLGLLSFVLCLGVFTGIPAIILGHVAKNRSQRFSAQHGGKGFAIAGLTLGYVSIAYTLLLAALLIPNFHAARAPSQARACSGQMRQIGLAFRIWSIDHQDQFPFNVSTNSGGTKEFCDRDANGFDRNARRHFAVLAPELGSTKILLCPRDKSKTAAPDFEHLTSGNITYRLRSGSELIESDPAEILAECPIHGILLHCDGSIEEKPGTRSFR
jgi:hypothetical protein